MRLFLGFAFLFIQTALFAQPVPDRESRFGSGLWNYSRHSSFHYQMLYLSSPRDGFIELGDGSQWKVAADDTRALFYWQYGDTMQLSLNGHGTGDYTFYLSNLSAHSGVRVNLVNGPIIGGIQTYTIYALDRVTGKLCLSNGTYWAISDADFALFSQWDIDDTILFGVYNGWFSSFSTLLVNVNLNTHLYVREVR